MASIITIIGLAVNLIGTALLLRTGVKVKSEYKGTISVTETDEKLYKRGLGFLIAGFAIQAIGVFIAFIKK